MRIKRELVAAIAILLIAAPSFANVKNFIKVCGDPKASAYDVVQFCQRALDTGRLDRRAEAQVRTNLGIGFFELQRYSEAVRQYDRAIELAPDFTPTYLNRARALARLRRVEDAMADYDTVLRQDPKSADAYYGRGSMLLNYGDAARAVADFDAAHNLQPAWTGPLFNRGVANIALGNDEKAVRDFSDVIQRAPSDAGAYLNRARAHEGYDPSAARADYDRAIELEPEWGAAWFARGQYWDAVGDREAANGDYLRAYELGHPDPWLVKRVREISG